MQLVAVQMTLDIADYMTQQAFREKIGSVMQRVAAQIDRAVPTLVAFPEDVGLMLVVQGLQDDLANVTTVAEAIEIATRKFTLPVAWLRLRHGLSWVPALFLHRHRIIAQSYVDVFSSMARQYGVYIVAGSVVLPPYPIRNGTVAWRQRPLDACVYNSSYLFDPTGAVVGRQDKVHLIDLEREAALDLTPGDTQRLRAFSTSLGKIGIAICLDAFQDEVIDALVEDGAEILVQPSANPGLWTEDQQIDWVRSSYQRTYERRQFAYAINPMMNGNVWDLGFFGQSSIVGQKGNSSMSYTHLDPMPGLLAVAATDRKEEILVVKVPRLTPRAYM